MNDFCEICMHGEVCKHRSAVESMETNLSSFTGNLNIPDILKVQIKCEKFIKRISPPFTYRNDAGECACEKKRNNQRATTERCTE